MAPRRGTVRKASFRPASSRSGRLGNGGAAAGRRVAGRTAAGRTIGALEGALHALAPAGLAEAWDNVGLLLGDASAPCRRVLVVVDFTRGALEEAVDLRVDAVVAYHPPIFDGFKRLRADDPRQAVILGAARAGVALLSPHTALDAVRGGVNDWLAEGVAGSWREVERARGYEPLRSACHAPAGEAFKVVVFVPHTHAVRVRDAMARAGAGVIGRYDQCATMAPVVGSFRGLAGSRPAVGKAGRVEEVAEIRLEMVAARERLSWALAAMRAVHPYETPACEVHALAAQPSLDEGQGRLLVLRQPASAAQIVARLRRHLKVRRIDVHAPAWIGGQRYERVGLCAGAGFGLAAEAAARGATLFVTGEARHHEQLAWVEGGRTLLLAGHTQTERGYMPRLARSLAEALPGVEFACGNS